MTTRITSISLSLSALAGSLGAQQAAETTSPTAGPIGQPVLLQWGDFDADGLQDALAITKDERVSLLRNAGDGSFEDVTQATGLDSIAHARFAIWNDYDADGLQDLFIGTGQGPSRLLQNLGAYFVDVSAESGFVEETEDLSARWFDYDGDGLQDLHVASSSGDTLYHAIAPGSFEPVGVTSHAPIASQVVITSAGQAGDAEDGLELSSPTDVPARPQVEATGRRAVSAPAQLQASSGLSGTGGGTVQNLQAGAFVAKAVDDTGNPGSIKASSTATLGMLYPLGSNFFVDEATGNVGIGTTSPTSGLHVTGSARFNGSTAMDSGVSMLRSPAASGFATLNLGPGGTYPIDQANASLLFRGDGFRHAGISFFPNTTAGLARMDMSMGFAFEPSVNPSIMSLLQDGRVGIGIGHVAPANTLSVLGSADVSGNLGIGTSSPQVPLDTTGRIRIGGAGSAPTTGVGIEMLYGSNRGAIFAMDRDTATPQNLTLNEPGGNVGIGTSLPTSPLHVIGDTRLEGTTTMTSGVNMQRSPAVTGSPTLIVGPGAPYTVDQASGSVVFRGDGFAHGGVSFRPSTTSGNARMEFSIGAAFEPSQNSSSLTILSNGRVGIGTNAPANELSVAGSVCVTGSYLSCSDERYKEAVQPLASPLETVRALEGVSYSWRTEEFPTKGFTDERQIGFMAQDVIDVVPEIVTQDADGYYSVAYGKLTPILVEAIKEQDKRLSAINAENETLRAANEELEVRVSRLESMEAELAGMREALALLTVSGN